jgi:proline iminopeptidase
MSSFFVPALISAAVFRYAEATMLIESGHARLFTTVHPRERSETVILLHGGPGVPMDFSPIAEQLLRKYQVIKFDQRGTGRSPAFGATFSINEYLDDIDAVARHFGLDRFHLFGHSWGGLYAQIYAEKNPQRLLSMFLLSPSSGTGKHWKQTEHEVMSFNKERSGTRGWFLMGIRSLLGMLGFDSAYRSLFKQVLENYHREFDPAFAATDAMVEHVRAEPINRTRPHIEGYPLLATVAHPFSIMIAYGEKDIYGKSKQHVRNRFPTAIIVEIERSGHIAWLHNAKRFSALLNDFYQLS